MNDDIKIQSAENNLDRLLEWVSRSDSKASIILGVDTGMLGAIAALAPKISSMTTLMILTATSSLILLFLSLLFIYLGSYPRTKGPNKSLLYFGSICKNSYREYQEEFLRQDSKEYLNDLLEQCHRNSEILNKKFQTLKWAHRFLFVGVPLWVATIYLFKMVAS